MNKLGSLRGARFPSLGKRDGKVTPEGEGAAQRPGSAGVDWSMGLGLGEMMDNTQGCARPFPPSPEENGWPGARVREECRRLPSSHQPKVYTPGRTSFPYARCSLPTRLHPLGGAPSAAKLCPQGLPVCSEARRHAALSRANPGAQETTPALAGSERTPHD